MRTGASINHDNGATMPPYAARLIYGCASRAITALMTGASAVISKPLAARGHQVVKMRRIETVVLVESIKKVALSLPQKWVLHFWGSILP